MLQRGDLGHTLLSLADPLTQAAVASRLHVVTERIDSPDLEMPLAQLCFVRTPDIVIVDISMEDQLAELLRSRESKVPTIIGLAAGARPTMRKLASLVQLGIDGIVTIADDLAESVNAVHESQNATSWVSPTLGALMLADFPKNVAPNQGEAVDITPSEQRILRLVADGYTDQAIANHIDRKERTVKYHLSSLYRKFDARNRAHLVSLATKFGILPDYCSNGQDAHCSNDRGRDPISVVK